MPKEKTVKKGGNAPVVPGVMIICSLSGSSLFGQRIKPHSLLVQKCKNGSLFAHCRIHSCRIFIGDKTIIHELTGESFYES